MPNAADMPVADEPPPPITVPHAAGAIHPNTQASINLSLRACQQHKPPLAGATTRIRPMLQTAGGHGGGA